MLRFRQRIVQRAVLAAVTSAALVIPLVGSASGFDSQARSTSEVGDSQRVETTVTGEPCAPGEGVTVEVDFVKAGETRDDPTQDRIVLGCAEGPQEDGFAALANAGFTTSSESGAGTICTIDGLPEQGFPYCWLDGGYWSYWRSDGTAAWSYSQVGAGNTGEIPVDSVEGWAFTMLDDDWESQVPRIAVEDLADHLPATEPAPAAPTVSGEACAPGEGVTTVVDYDATGDNSIEVRCAEGAHATGLAALEAAGYALGLVPGQDDALCTIDEMPSGGYPSCWDYLPEYGYWGYYLGDGTDWKASELGGGSTEQPLAVDAVIGWHFTSYADEAWPNPPRVALEDVLALARDPKPGDPEPEPTPAPALGAKRFAVTAPTKPVVRGKRIKLTARGLAPRERYTVRVAGKKVRTGKANASGRLSVTVRVPKSVRQGKKRALKVVGSRNNRAGARTLKVVTPRFRATVKNKRVRTGGTQVVRLARLLPGEKVVVRVGGKRVSPKSAKANRRGVYRLKVKVGKKRGRTLVRATSVKGRSATVRFVVRR